MQTKVKKMNVKKLAEFNYKLLNGTLPCGQILCKWIGNISSNCTVCGVTEDHKHMLFECVKVNYIWKLFSNCCGIDVQWKHIIIGYYENLNKATRYVNFLCTFIAYSIFKVNNNCKWKQVNYAHQDVTRKVIKDLLDFNKLQALFRDNIIEIQYIENVITYLEN